MNNYPRLYRLSTVNLIYHGDNDFDLNPFRTDFTGNGGVGKSLLADILQLIFIGSSEYKTATISEGERPVKTMVVKSKNTSFDFGYAILTIEKSPNQFLGIGIYIPNGADQPKSFIVQQGYKFGNTDTLVTFKTPLSFKDFIIDSDNAVRPLDINVAGNCKEYLMELKGVILEELGHEHFFKILSYNDILPIKVSDYKDSVKVYKQIIRTFARGNRIDFTKDKVLKEFLFGHEDKNKIWDHYENTKEELNKNISEHQETVKESDKITQRLNDLKGLLKIKTNKESKYSIWLNANLGYYKNQYIQNEKSFTKTIETIIIGLQKLKNFKNFLNKQKEPLEKEYEKLLKINGVLIKENHEKLAVIQEWFKYYDISKIDDLETIYSKQIANLNRSKQIKELEKNLSEKGVLNFFKNTNWVQGYNLGFAQNKDKIEEIKLKITQKESIQSFSDLSNTNSLAYWAINRDTPLTREQESVLMHFQTLSIQKPNVFQAKSQYLPNPDRLFSNLITQQEGNGFWVNLGGILEFVPYATMVDFSTIRDSLEQLNELSKNDLETLRGELKSWEDTLDVVTKINTEIVNSYQHKKEVDSFNYNKGLDIPQKNFDDYLELYSQKDEILKEFGEWTSNENRKTDVRGSINAIIQLTTLIENLSPIDKYKEIWTQSNLEIEETINISTENYGIDGISWENYYKRFKIPSIEAFNIQYEQFVKSKNDYEGAKKLLPDHSKADEIELIEKEPTIQRKEFDIAEKEYNIKYEVVAKYLPESERGKVLDGSYNFIELGREILPAILRNEQMLLDDDVVNIVDDKLKIIQDKSKVFISNKIKSLKLILDEIKKSFKRYSEQQRDIESFLKKQRKDKNLISQEFEPILRWQKGDIDIKWIDEFQKVEQNWNGLFMNEHLHQLLSKLITLDEVLLKIFEEITNTKSEIKEILDPHSYYNLEYEMFNEEYKNTGISNSQNYSMIALLCIARLSIIEKKQSKGIRFMPIDEAESLGTNFDMLHNIAQAEGYQIIAMSIVPIISLDEINRTVYILRRNLNIKNIPVNHQPKKMTNTLIEEDEEYDTNEVEISQSFE